MVRRPFAASAAPLVFALALVAPPAVPVRVAAQDLPHALTGDLIRIEHEFCATSTGYGQSFVRFADVDGDGRADVVLDYADALCGGVHEPYCGKDGCLMVVWVAGRGGYRKAFEGRVHRWSLEPAAKGHTVLSLDGRPLGG